MQERGVKKKKSLEKGRVEVLIFDQGYFPSQEETRWR
jgi:hypothetical protein